MSSVSIPAESSISIFNSLQILWSSKMRFCWLWRFIPPVFVFYLFVGICLIFLCVLCLCVCFCEMIVCVMFVCFGILPEPNDRCVFVICCDIKVLEFSIAFLIIAARSNKANFRKMSGFVYFFLLLVFSLSLCLSLSFCLLSSFSFLFVCLSVLFYHYHRSQIWCIFELYLGLLFVIFLFHLELILIGLAFHWTVFVFQQCLFFRRGVLCFCFCLFCYLKKETNRKKNKRKEGNKKKIILWLHDVIFWDGSISVSLSIWMKKKKKKENKIK